MTALMWQFVRLCRMFDRWVRHVLHARQRRVFQEYERRSRWAEQARETPTLRQLQEAGAARFVRSD